MSTSPADDVVEVTRPHEHVAVVALNRPARLNALDDALLAALPETLDGLAADRTVRVVVVTGRGRGFCSGADLATLAEPQSSREAAGAWMRRAQRGALALRMLPQPTIAAVNGAAVGAGLGLALACDIRLAAPEALMSAAFAHLGLGPDFGVSRWLAEAVGHARAHELLYTGRQVESAEALEIGLVLRVTADVHAAALDLAVTIAAHPADAVRSIKRTLRLSRDADDERVLTEIEPDAQAQLLLDPSFASRVRAGFGSRPRGAS